MRKLLCAAFTVAVVWISAANSPALAAQPPAKTIVVVMTADQEIPLCTEATNAARGVAIFHVTDQATGTVEYKIIANNLPGTITAAHIHVTPPNPGPVVQPLPLKPGAENGVIGTGPFTNPTLLAAIQASPDSYYVNVHSSVCQPGVIRGQLGDHGPLHG